LALLFEKTVIRGGFGGRCAETGGYPHRLLRDCCGKADFLKNF
jgi:hypothetical protein